MGVMTTILGYLVITAAELGLAGWLGKKEEIFSFKTHKYTIIIAVGNLLLLVFAIWKKKQTGNEAVWYFGIWAYLFGLAIYDLKCRELPDWWHLLPAVPCGAVWLMRCQPVQVKESLFAVLVLAAVFGLVYLLRKDAIGLGDIKLILVCAFYLGRLSFGMICWGMMAAFVCSIILLVCKKATPASGLPFAPFLLFGALFI